jgi:hypothetical protein
LRGIFEYKSHEQIKRNEAERLGKQVKVKTLLDEIHHKEGAWK